MSIMRSFTTRRKQPELDPNTPIVLGRAASQRAGRPVLRAQISSPVALVSTTNMLSYNAPNIAGTTPIENASSSEESSEDSAAGSVHSHETDPTDLSSTESSPTSAEPNHLSQYFKAAVDAAKPSRSLSNASRSTFAESPSPALPRRAPSHSKRAHEALSRKLSVQRARSPSAQGGRGVSRTRTSADIFNLASALVDPPSEMPTAAQLDVVDEEYAAAAATTPNQMSEDEFDILYLQTKGLAHVSAADYLSEIDDLKAVYLDDNSPTVPDFSGWF